MESMDFEIPPKTYPLERLRRFRNMAREFDRMERKRMWRMERMAKKRMERKRMESMSNQEQMMFQLVHHMQWEKVVSLFEGSLELLGSALTATHETTLHLAIMTGNKNAVRMLLVVLKNADNRIDVRDILTRKNDDGVTPIHLAVTLDMDEACLEMARLCPDLVTQVRNKDGETLLFQAVREGNKDLFFALELLVPNPPPDKMKRDVTHCRRSDGNNILHIAIYGESFGLHAN